jgi:hypothetical protein
MKRQNNNCDNRRVAVVEVLIVFLFILFSGAGGALGQTTTPVMVDYFDTGGFGAPSPNGVTFISSGTFANHFAIVDDNPDKIFIADRSGILKKEIDISGISNTATGITFIPGSGNLAVLDRVTTEVYIFNFSGVLQDQFDTSAFGATSPQGITYVSSGTFANNFAIVDNIQDSVYFVDSNGSLQGSFSTSGYSVGPTGIAFIPGTGNLAIMDNGAARNVFIVNTSGIEQDRFSVSFLSNGNLGITYDSSAGNIAVASAAIAEIFSLDAEGSTAGQIDITPLGSTQASGITYMPTTGNYAIVDLETDEVYFMKPDGTKVDQCDISAFSNFAEGITFIPSTGNLALVDRSLDDVLIIDTECNLLEQFDIATFGIDALTPNGIVSVSGGRGVNGQFQIVDANRNGVKRIDPARPGRIRSQFSTAAYNFLSAQGIALIDNPGHLAIVNNNPDNVYIMDFKGVLLGIFEVTQFSPVPRGIAFDSDNNLIAVVDSSTDQVTFFDLPSLLDQLEDSSCNCDINDDGDVDGEDLFEFSKEFGRDDCQ